MGDETEPNQRNSSHQTKCWLIPEFDNLELFQAEAIHYSYARHSHPGYSIGMIEAGVGGNHYQGTTYLAPANSVIFMNPDTAHTGYSAEGLPLTYRMLYPSLELMQQIASELQLQSLPQFKQAVVQNAALAQKIRRLHTTLERSCDPLERQSYLVTVLSEILLGWAAVQDDALPDRQEHHAVRTIKNYLHDHYASNVSLDQLAELTNLNRSYLIRVFHQAVGMPPYAYFTQIRVEKAKQLLRHGTTVAETAIAVGMADQSHLTRRFKRIVGVTPGHYHRMSMSAKSVAAKSVATKSTLFKTDEHHG
jgi:AraC-like DNA-binding protein